MEKQTLSTLATITAISVAIITPTSALAEDMKYNQAIYEEIGMDRSEVIDWVQDGRTSVQHPNGYNSRTRLMVKSMVC